MRLRLATGHDPRLPISVGRLMNGPFIAKFAMNGPFINLPERVIERTDSITQLGDELLVT
jgi:hypothetical protein